MYTNATVTIAFRRFKAITMALDAISLVAIKILRVVQCKLTQALILSKPHAHVKHMTHETPVVGWWATVREHTA